jgi:hypothetical protein
MMSTMEEVRVACRNDGGTERRCHQGIGQTVGVAENADSQGRSNWRRIFGRSCMSLRRATRCGPACSGPTCRCASCLDVSKRWARLPADELFVGCCVSLDWDAERRERRKRWAIIPTATLNSRTLHGCERSIWTLATRSSASTRKRRNFGPNPNFRALAWCLYKRWKTAQPCRVVLCWATKKDVSERGARVFS